MPALRRLATASGARLESSEAASQPWWTQASALAGGVTDSALPPAYYRLGEAVLEIASDSPALIGALADHYGECAVPASQGGSIPCVRCSVRVCDDNRLALVRFTEPASIDAFALALALLKHPAADPLYTDQAPTADGWHLIAQSGTGVPVIATRGSQALVDRARTPVRFLADLVITPVLAAQRALLFAHAASIGMGGAGVLLFGPSGSGKTTTALTLASRGHAYFGDDIAAIRTASTELLAFWRTAHIRPGPHARALVHHVETGHWDPPYADGMPRLRLRVAELFPQAPAAAVPLRLALFIRRFAMAPKVEPFAAAPQIFGSPSRLDLNGTLLVAWGTTPQRRLLQFMLFARMLARVRCAWLDVGDPESTADLIETAMEESWD